MEGRPVRVGFTGHQRLTKETEELIRGDLRDALQEQAAFQGICSLAEGGDQIFAQTVLDLGGHLIAVIPCDRYEDSFTNAREVAAYRRLLRQSARTVKLRYRKPSEQAFWAAGQRMVRESDSVLAVWDGGPSGGLGGTADVVSYARARATEVKVIWPPGAARR